MTVKNYLKSALIMACTTCLSVATFAATWTTEGYFSKTFPRTLHKEITINPNHTITVDAKFEFFHQAMFGLYYVRGSAIWPNNSEDVKNFKITEVIKYTEDGIEVIETNIFSEFEGQYEVPQAWNYKNEIIDGKKYIENHFQVFSLNKISVQDGRIIIDQNGSPALTGEPITGGGAQAYDPSKTSSRSVYRGLFVISKVYWHQNLSNIDENDTVDPNNLEFIEKTAGHVATTHVILNTAGAQNELGMFAHNFTWKYVEDPNPR